MVNTDRKTISGMIDHTLLRATATSDEIREYCRQAVEYNFASVCVNPYHVKLVTECLKGSEVRVCTVVGFPLGANTLAVKVFEAERAVEEGAQEIDMVINIAALKEGNISYVENEIREVVKASKKAIVKVIIETCYLSDDEKIAACEAAKRAGAHFVKTSTGFGTSGAKLEDVILMKKAVEDSLGVKASGGVKSLEDAVKFIEAGVSRIGTSSGISLIKDELAVADESKY